MYIDFLVNHSNKIEDVSEMIYKEFVIKSGSKMMFADVVEHFSNTKVARFPITLVALEDGKGHPFTIRRSQNNGIMTRVAKAPTTTANLRE